MVHLPVLCSVVDCGRCILPNNMVTSPALTSRSGRRTSRTMISTFGSSLRCALNPSRISRLSRFRSTARGRNRLAIISPKRGPGGGRLLAFFGLKLLISNEFTGDKWCCEACSSKLVAPSGSTGWLEGLKMACKTPWEQRWLGREKTQSNWALILSRWVAGNPPVTGFRRKSACGLWRDEH